MFKTCVEDTINPTCCFTNQDIKTHCFSDIDNSSKNDKPIFVESIIYPGKNMIHKNEGKNVLIKVKNSKINMNGMLECTIEYPHREQRKMPREYMSCLDTSNIAFVPIQIP